MNHLFTFLSMFSGGRPSVRFRILHFVFVVVLALSIVPLGTQFRSSGHRALAATVQGVPVRSASVTIDGVKLEVASPIMPQSTFATTNPGDEQQAASVASYLPLRELTIIAIPYSTRNDVEAPIVASAGSAGAFRDALRARQHDAKHVATVTSTLFGQAVTGEVWASTVKVAGTITSHLEVWWVTEAGRRVWIVQVAADGLVGVTQTQFLSHLNSLVVRSSNLNQPTTVGSKKASPLLPAFPHQHTPPWMSGMPAPTFGLPPWWYGADCDSGWNSQHNVIGNWGTLEACGYNNDVWSRGYGSWNTELEWECVELSQRYLNQQYGIPNVGANGDQVVDATWAYLQAHPGLAPQLTRLYPGSGSVPVAGDVMSYEPNHTDVVIASSVDQNGNGQYETLNENWNGGAPGSAYQWFSISNWAPQYPGGYVIDWLHDTTSGQPIGHVESVDGVTANGWAFDPDVSSTSIDTQISIDGNQYDMGPTPVYRPDVNAQYGITGNHGFAWAIPSQWRDGMTHSWQIYAIDPDNGNTPTLIGSGSFAHQATFANLLRNASFEASGFANWHQWDGNINVGSGTPGLDDSYYLVSNTSTPSDSFYQDVKANLDTSHDYTFSIWARSGVSGKKVSGTLALYPDIGFTDDASTKFTVGPNWQLISVTIDPAYAHSWVRAQVYLSTTGTNFNFDGAQLVPNLLRNASFEASGFANWHQWDGNINVGSGTPGLDDSYYLISNTGYSMDSFYQDVKANLDTSHDYTFSIWARSGVSGKKVSGTLALYPDIGFTDDASTKFTVGPNWQLISVTIDPAYAHSWVRAQVYLSTTGTNFNFDGAQLVPNLLRNASFEASGFANWHQWDGNINVGSGTPGLDDGYYLISNTSIASDSFYQDVKTNLDTSHDYTFSIWARSGTSGKVSGTLALYPDIGFTDDASTKFTVGPNWQLISVTIDPAYAHSWVRAQVYLSTTGTNFNFDGARLTG